jgi:hypothetical protein
MAAQEAKEYYYHKGKIDFMTGFYEQPFPSPMLIELDEFEMLCNKSYKSGYGEAMEGGKR